ncbi:MAG: family 78 glycoside hydrolase catalytic domain [Cyclobacteriaceae bacterium]|nr:family 78 glycoside hydrolase catalytic domain [Cyclobacteriaceae bacterium]
MYTPKEKGNQQDTRDLTIGLLSMMIIVLMHQSLFAQSTPRPNIIFILTDDQRWDAQGYAGNEIISTPEMDKLASEGVYFSQAFVTTPICAASRASIFSGVHERTHRYNFETGSLKEAFYHQSYPLLLRKSGYFTGFYGKFGVRYQSIDPLFDVYEDYDRGHFSDRRGYYYKTINKDTVHLTRYTGQQALDFIEQAPKEQPFCLSLSFSAPHAHDSAPEQYFWQKETDTLYQKMDMPPPFLGDVQYFDELPKPVREGYNRLRWTWRYDTPEKYQQSVKGYYRMISGVDMEIAKIRNKLKSKGLDDNTIIILMGDNGYFMGERQLAGKWLLYDNSLRVPMIVYDPRVKQHLDIDEMTLNIDVPATMLDLAGVPQPLSWQGKSLMPLVNHAKTTLDRDTILIEHLWDFKHIPPSEGVRTRQWKYFRYVNDKRDEELYNLLDDPMEIKNLAKNEEFASVLTALRKKCTELSMQYADPFSGKPFGLMVDFIRNPTGTSINSLQPNYSWIIPGVANFQNAYQILVSSSRDSIDKNIGDVWNSGQVRSNTNINVVHAGSPLQAQKSYFWKIRIWDQSNRLSEYSTLQKFTTGQPDGNVASNNNFQIDRLEPVSFTNLSRNNYFIDFGRDAFASLELKYSCRQKEILTIHLGEKLDENKVDRHPPGTVRYQEVKLHVKPEQKIYQIALRPDERNTNSKAIALPDSFPVLMPFRYAEIHGANSKIKQEDVTQLAYHAYFEDEQSNFISHDTILNQVWDMCKYTIKATSFAGYYVDGERERIPYEADAYLNQLSHYTTDREYALARRTIEYFMQHPTWPTEWQLHVVLMVYQDYMYTGNTQLIEKYYEKLKFKSLMALAREDGLISTQSDMLTPDLMLNLGFSDPDERLNDIVDWPPAQKDTGWKLATEEGERDGFVFMPINTVVNSLYYKNMEILADFARVLNKPDEELDFRLKAALTKKSINDKLFDTRTGAYVDGEGTPHASVHANMFALAFGLVPEMNKVPVLNFIKTRGMACSVYGAQYLMEALFQAGAADYALQLMTATNDRSWYNMISAGASMAMEAWDMKYKPNADWNHAWGAVPANIIPRYLWGIQPATPGYGVVSIHPQLGDLRNSAIVTPTIRGSIKAEYEWKSTRLQVYNIELPGNMVGELLLTVATDSDVTRNGKQVHMHFGSIRLEPGINKIEVRINSF